MKYFQIWRFLLTEVNVSTNIYDFLWAVGLQYDVINKKLGSSAEREGLHNGPPGFEFIVFPSVFRSLEFSLKVGYSENVMILFDLGKKSYDASIKNLIYVSVLKQRWRRD